MDKQQGYTEDMGERDLGKSYLVDLVGVRKIF